MGHLRSIYLGHAITCSLLIGQGIGSGNPGLRIDTRGQDRLVIFEDEPQTMGASLRGGMQNRKIKVVIDQGYNFGKELMLHSSQLFPFGPNAAFTSRIGSWNSARGYNYKARSYIGYRLLDGRVTVFQDVQREATLAYQLPVGAEFLGYIDHRVFYWNDFKPTHVFWREEGSSRVSRVELPKGVIDIWGVTRGIRKDIAILLFRQSHGFFKYSPYTEEVFEFTLSKGAPFVP